jgi:hypothetical protein
MNPARAGIKRLAASFSLFARRADLFIGFDVPQCDSVSLFGDDLVSKKHLINSSSRNLWRYRMLSSTILIRAFAVMKSTLRIGDSAKYFVSIHNVEAHRLRSSAIKIVLSLCCRPSRLRRISSALRMHSFINSVRVLSATLSRSILPELLSF